MGDSTATAESLTGTALELDTQCNTTPQALRCSSREGSLACCIIFVVPFYINK